MNKAATVNVEQSFPMKGGDGSHSYTRNSNLQRAAANASKSMLEEAIAEKLDIQSFSSNTIRLADLGCSVGPNTFIAMQNVIKAVESKHLARDIKSQRPEFQVFFNDHAANDFNTLFASLPTDRLYFASGVPGSFHGRLFPESSIHFMHSSYALQWLSKVPEDVLDKNSPAWNRGRIHYVGGPAEVAEAYTAQFDKDMEIFLSARATELVVGGIMVLIMPAVPDGISFSQIPSGVLFNLLGSGLMDMAEAGLINEAQVDSFNLPVYAVSLEQMRGLVERNGCFNIERMELTCPAAKLDGPVSGQACIMHLRAGMEGIIAKYFGIGIMDELFDRISKKTEEVSHQLESSYKNGTQLFVVLKRK